MSQAESDEVLGLTVHSLPKPGEPAGANVSGRLKLLAVFLACSLPVLVAYFVFYVVRPQGAAGFGELITPVRELPITQGADLNGVKLPLTSLKGQWLLVKVDGGDCQQECQKQLLVLRQFRLMLGKDMDRVDWLWLISDQAPVAATLAASLRHDSATVLRVDAGVLQSWLPAPAGKTQQDFIYVVDPMGNAMMRFPSLLDSASAAKAKRDMEHLLRASLSWDTPGRQGALPRN
ncbi:MAG: cytochrome oxidase assembly protein Sco1/SenC family [Pseudomonadota bacterium]